MPRMVDAPRVSMLCGVGGRCLTVAVLIARRRHALGQWTARTVLSASLSSSFGWVSR